MAIQKRRRMRKFRPEIMSRLISLGMLILMDYGGYLDQCFPNFTVCVCEIPRDLVKRQILI